MGERGHVGGPYQHGGRFGEPPILETRVEAPRASQVRVQAGGLQGSSQRGQGRALLNLDGSRASKPDPRRSQGEKERARERERERESKTSSSRAERKASPRFRKHQIRWGHCGKRAPLGSQVRSVTLTSRVSLLTGENEDVCSDALKTSSNRCGIWIRFSPLYGITNSQIQLFQSQ